MDIYGLQVLKTPHQLYRVVSDVAMASPSLPADLWDLQNNDEAEALGIGQAKGDRKETCSVDAFVEFQIRKQIELFCFCFFWRFGALVGWFGALVGWLVGWLVVGCLLFVFVIVVVVVVAHCCLWGV